MNICVFGSSSEQIDKIYLESAEHLGKKIAEKGYNLVFGAGKYGVMGASARGAYSAGGHTIGVTPEFFIDVGVVFDKCSELIVTDTMRDRKGIMEDKARELLRILNDNGYDAYIVGGFTRDVLLGRMSNDIDICTSATT